MVNYFFTSDTHFNHYNIMQYCARPFGSLEEMNETIIKNWNSVVKKDDFIYHLGDFGWGGLQKNQEIFSRLNGRKYLIKGNHDSNSIRQLGWVWVKDAAMIKVYDKYIFLFHYPLRTWNRAMHGAWHLFGHIHNKLAQFWLSFNVGVDAHDFIPLSFDQVEVRMDHVTEENNYLYHQEVIAGEFDGWEEQF